MADLEVVRTRRGLEGALQGLRSRGRVALVPTMGYLHEGHLSLVELARGAADAVAVSIFVNPLQFGPGEDLDAYPRDEERDLALLEGRGATLVFAPSLGEMYPNGDPSVTVDPGALEDALCGRFRPGHFRGVLTVVARLFGLFRPQVAVFGRKDYQQGVLVRRMVRDLYMGVDVLLGGIVREEDGLAMSSRNAYLEPEQRAQAAGIHVALEETRERFAAGERSGAALRDGLRTAIDAHPLLRTQYADLVDPDTLASLDRAEAGAVAAVAAFCGRTRLIDNVELG